MARMEKKQIASGKTKDLYDLGNGIYQLYFKDDMTGENGVFDPGANTVGLTVEGAGRAGLAMSVYFFKRLNDLGCPTHFISADIEKGTMNVRQAKVFGKGLEVICRFNAMGSFIRRYGDYIAEGTPLEAVVEMTLKDDQRGDPLINQEAAEAIGLLKETEYQDLSRWTKRICHIIKAELAEIGLQLCDIKLEFGRDTDGKILLIDEISGGNMRVLDNGQPVSPLALSARICEKKNL